MMVGLHLLKHARGVSDDQVCAQWIENAYFQFFCGETYFQTKLPLDRTSMSVWRGRIGADKLELLLAETLATATRAKAVDKSQMQRVTVDTTAQTKAIAHPTDSHLLLRAIEWLNKLAKKHGIDLRQSYLRLARRARREVGRLIHGRGHKQAMRYLRKMRTWAARLVRDIERKIDGQPDLQHACEPSGSSGSSSSWRRSPTTRTRSTPCMRPRWSASPRARRARAMNLASKRPSPSPTRAPTAVSSCSESKPFLGSLTTATR
jgi:hypothetical protein